MLLHMRWLRQNESNVSFLSALVDSVQREPYFFSPALEYKASLDKERYLLRYTERDAWVVKALAIIVRDRSSPILSDSVMAYRKGRGPLRAMRRISKFLRKNQANGNRNFFVIRRDIAAYTDSIPLGDDSPLWPRLNRLSLSEVAMTNLKSALKVSRYHQDLDQNKSDVFVREKGIPMGSTLTPWLANLYLMDFDSWMRAQDLSALYLRYGDDLIWIGTSETVALRLIKELPKQLEREGLSENLSKKKNIAFNSSGSFVSPQWESKSTLSYLGRELTFSGHISISGEKRSEILNELRQRLLALKSSGVDSLELAYECLNDFVSTQWRADPRSANGCREVNHPGTLRSLRIDFVREIARVFLGGVSNYHLRKAGYDRAISEFGWHPRGVSLRE